MTKAETSSPRIPESALKGVKTAKQESEKAHGLVRGDRISGNDGYTWKVGPKVDKNDEKEATATVAAVDGKRELVDPKLDLG